MPYIIISRIACTSLVCFLCKTEIVSADLTLLSLQALKEKTELQAQLAAVNVQLQAKTEEAQFNQEKQSALNAEVGMLRQNCSQLEKAMMELQGNLESKNASLASLGNDLKVAEDQYGRLMVKVEEMQNTVASKDNTGETASNRCVEFSIICRTTS